MFKYLGNTKKDPKIMIPSSPDATPKEKLKLPDCFSDRVLIQKGKIKLEISDDFLTAVLHLSPDEYLNLNVLYEELDCVDKADKTKKTTYEMNFSVEDVKNTLKNHSVTYGIIKENIALAVSQPVKQSVVIAIGLPPERGLDDTIEEYFSNEIKRTVFKIKNNEVDFREHQIIPQIVNGDILAKKNSGVNGVDGISVLGKTVPAEKIKKINLIAGYGTTILNDEIVIATESGRPMAEGKNNKRYSIVKTYFHPADVDISSGNIRFDGDIIIEGNVAEGMSVNATGNIVIKGNIDNASIVAGEGILIFGHAINSSIIGCEKIAIYEDLLKIIKQQTKLLFVEIFKEFVYMQKGLSPLSLDNGETLNLIILKYGNAFFSLTESIIENINKMSPNTFPTKIIDSGQTIHDLSIKLKNTHSLTNSEIVILFNNVKTLAEYFTDHTIKKKEVILYNVLNCNIFTNGDVRINGSECFHSDIKSGGRIYLNGQLRGGTLSANENMVVRSIGSNLEVVTKLKVPIDKSVQIMRAFAGSQIFIGNLKYTVIEEDFNFIVTNKNGMLKRTYIIRTNRNKLQVKENKNRQLLS